MISGLFPERMRANGKEGSNLVHDLEVTICSHQRACNCRFSAGCNEYPSAVD